MKRSIIRRSGGDERRFAYTTVFPERRKHQRRTGKDRRKIS
jgi:hypothetical protein